MPIENSSATKCYHHRSPFDCAVLPRTSAGASRALVQVLLTPDDGCLRTCGCYIRYSMCYTRASHMIGATITLSDSLRFRTPGRAANWPQHKLSWRGGTSLVREHRVYCYRFVHHCIRDNAPTACRHGVLRRVPGSRDRCCPLDSMLVLGSICDRASNIDSGRSLTPVWRKAILSKSVAIISTRFVLTVPIRPGMLPLDGRKVPAVQCRPGGLSARPAEFVVMHSSLGIMAARLSGYVPHIEPPDVEQSAYISITPFITVSARQ